MMSFREFFNETALGMEQSKDGIFWKDARGRKKLNIVPDINKVSGNKVEEIINSIRSGRSTSETVTPDLLQHIKTTYDIDERDLSQPKTLGNSNVVICNVRGANGQPIMMLRRKS